MLFTPNQILELLKIVDKYTTTFLAHTVGTSVLTGDDTKLLVNSGFDLGVLRDMNGNLNIDQAFKFGMLSDALGDSAAKNMTYDQFKKFLSSGKFIPLNTVELGALNALKYQTASEVKRLASGIKSNIESTLVRIDKNDRAVHAKVVTDAAKKIIEERKTVSQLALELGNQTEKWNKDLGKIADYVMHEAFNEGRVASIKKKGAKVYFNVYPGACKHCARLYLTAGPGSEPKIFDIDEIKANGTNIGRKAAEWKATISPVHPYCRCTVTEFPEGYLWNPSTQAFDIPKKFTRKVNRKSKIKVTVNNKTTVI